MRENAIATSQNQTAVALNEHLNAHVEQLQDRWETALAQHEFDGAWLSAGDADFYFQDDHGPKFKANPYLGQWVDPGHLSPGAKMLLRAGHKPVLFLHQPADYWHAATPLPEDLGPYLDIRSFAEVQDLLDACQQEIGAQLRLAHIGPETHDNESWGDPNPPGLINHLHFHRATKTTYELAAMRHASIIGARGHIAAAAAFAQGGTEFDIHMAFLQASQQVEGELPYGNIVALNEHASILHYQHQERSHQRPAQSLLIDAGGNYRGYASDITRSYVALGVAANNDFADLLGLMESHQQKLAQSVAPGMTFAALHEQMHRQLGDVLVAAKLVTCSAEAAFAEGITEAFCPHGLGHLLGLQVHDVGGHLADEQGNPAPPSARYPTLRFTREIEVDHVFTIEPGLYFIPSLLAELHSKGADVDWQRVDAMRPFGGIRIEDNLRVLQSGAENMTRDAFANAL